MRPGLAVPVQLHRGSASEAVILRSQTSFVAQNRDAFSFIAVRRLASLSESARFTSSKTLAFRNIWIKIVSLSPGRTEHGGVDNAMEHCWFAQLRLVFSLTDNLGRQHSCALVRWLERVPDRRLSVDFPFVRLKWEVSVRGVQQPRSGSVNGRYDVIAVNRIVRPVFLQSHPLQPGVFFYNHFV